MYQILELGIRGINVNQLIEKRMRKVGSWKVREWDKERKKWFKYRGGGKWKVRARMKSEYPNSRFSFGVFLLVFFSPNRLIIFIVELACLYLVYIV